MLETHAGQSANQIHLVLKSALQKMAEAEKCAVTCFGVMMARKLYRELGYSSINRYAEAELDFATTHSRRELEREVKTAKREAAETAKGQPTLLPVPRQAPVDQVETSLAVMQSFTAENGQGAKKSSHPAARPDPYPPLCRMRESIGANQPRRAGNRCSGTGTSPVRLPRQPPGTAQHDLDPTGHKTPGFGGSAAQMPTPWLKSPTAVHRWNSGTTIVGLVGLTAHPEPARPH